MLDEPANLPEGTEVEVSPVETAHPVSWAEVLKEVIGAAKDLPADSALNHDHYLYGTGKK